MSMWSIAKQQMDQDLSYLFNKDKICEFQFSLQHDYKWWIKWRKNLLTGIFTSFVLIMIIGLIICLLQIWWDESHPVTINTTYNFVLAGMIFWCACTFIYVVIFLWQANYMRKAWNALLPYFAKGVREGYLCPDETQYPEVIRMAFYGNDTMSWRMHNPQSRFQYSMPIFGTIALFSQIKDYQAKYCPVNHNNQSNA